MSDYRDDQVVKGAVRAIELQITATEAFVVTARPLVALPALEGSARAAIESWLDELAVQSPETVKAARSIQEVGLSGVGRLLQSALDHAYGLRALLTDDKVLLSSPFGIARGLLEAVVQACFLLDPWIPATDRVLRMLAYHVATVEGGLTTLNSFGKNAGGVDRARTIAGIEALHAWLNENSFERDPEPKNPLSTRRVGFRNRWVGLEFNVTAAATKYMPKETFFYAILSGAAHGRGWFLAGHYGLDDGTPGATRASVATSCALLVLSLSDALVEIIGRYVGTPYEQIQRQTHGRRTLLAALPDPGTSNAVGFEDYHARATRASAPRRGHDS